MSEISACTAGKINFTVHPTPLPYILAFYPHYTTRRTLPLRPLHILHRQKIWLCTLLLSTILFSAQNLSTMFPHNTLKVHMFYYIFFYCHSQTTIEPPSPRIHWITIFLFCLTLPSQFSPIFSHKPFSGHALSSCPCRVTFPFSHSPPHVHLIFLLFYSVHFSRSSVDNARVSSDGRPDPELKESG